MNVKNENVLEKYEKIGFLNGVDDNKKETLSKLYDEFTKYLITFGDEKLKFGNCDFSILFIPLIRELYIVYNETDYIKIFKDFKEWYSLEGVILEKNNNISDKDFLISYLKHYEKEIKKM